MVATKKDMASRVCCVCRDIRILAFFMLNIKITVCNDSVANIPKHKMIVKKVDCCRKLVCCTNRRVVEPQHTEPHSLEHVSIYRRYLAKKTGNHKTKENPTDNTVSLELFVMYSNTNNFVVIIGWFVIPHLFAFLLTV